MIYLENLKAAALATKEGHGGELSNGGLVMAARWYHEQRQLETTLYELRRWAQQCIGAGAQPLRRKPEALN